MPETQADLLWWAFNGAFFLLVAWAKLDLGEIKRDIRETRTLSETNTKELAAHRAVCAERHRVDRRSRDKEDD